MNIGTIRRFQANLDRIRIDGPTGLALYEALPEAVRQEWDRREIVRRADQRYAAGQVGLKSYRRSRPSRPIPPKAPPATADDWRDGVEVLAGIPAETYLPILDPDTEPSRGRCRCPLPDHADENPSATYRDSVWYCHRCATGGGIFTAASAISGLGDRGDDFCDLRAWVAERVLGVRA